MFPFVLKVLQNILETETEYSKDLQSLLTIYLRPLQNTDKYVSSTPKLLSNQQCTLLTFGLKCFFTFILVHSILSKCPNLCWLFPNRLSSLDVALILGNLEEICTFQQMLVQSLEECTRLVPPHTPLLQPRLFVPHP